MWDTNSEKTRGGKVAWYSDTGSPHGWSRTNSVRATLERRAMLERCRRDGCANRLVGGVFRPNHAYQGATHFFFNMCNSISLMSSLGKLMPRCRSTRCFYVNCNVVREPSRPALLRRAIFFSLFVGNFTCCCPFLSSGVL